MGVTHGEYGVDESPRGDHGDDRKSGVKSNMIGIFCGGKQGNHGEDAGAGGANGEDEDEEIAEVLVAGAMADVIDAGGKDGNPDEGEKGKGEAIPCGDKRGWKCCEMAKNEIGGDGYAGSDNTARLGLDLEEMARWRQRDGHGGIMTGLFRAANQAKTSANAARAALKPHMPWTPPPGGVEAEQR